MTTAIVHPHRSWMPAVNLLAASAAIALSVTALVVAADDPQPAPAAARQRSPQSPHRREHQPTTCAISASASCGAEPPAGTCDHDGDTRGDEPGADRPGRAVGRSRPRPRRSVRPQWCGGVGPRGGRGWQDAARRARSPSRLSGRAVGCASADCVDLGERIWPLAPLREIVSGLVDDLDAVTLDRVLGRARPVMARLVPELDDDRDTGAPVTSEQVCELTSACSSASPSRGRCWSWWRTCTGPTTRPAPCSRRWREWAASGPRCCSGRSAPTSCTGATRFGRCWPRSIETGRAIGSRCRHWTGSTPDSWSMPSAWRPSTVH